MTALRIAIGVLGLAVGAYGGVELLDLGLENLAAAATWLAGGVIVHDAVVAPLTVATCLVVSRVRRRAVPAPVVVAAVVITAVTVTAVPVLGRFGARADNATLLDRNYVLGWLVLATLTVIVTVVAVAVSRLERGGDRGQGAGRR
jgi:hypothetical protein